jgi:exosortase A
MPPELAARIRTGPGVLAAIPDRWRSPLALLALAWTGNLLLLLPDWADMAGQWWNISTYNHILLVPAILAWLVRERLPYLTPLTPRGWWPALFPVAGAVLLWVLGAVAGVSIARQLAAVALMVFSVPALLGPRVGAVLAFPLAYMLFMVPFGDELVPALQTITAAITIWLVQLSGVDAAIDGVLIHTPAGLFEVAEACSGVKFLIAMAAFGVLGAGVCFQSWRRRAAFLAVCLVVPVLANGVRAWATVFAAQYVGAERAAGFDHIVYGWIFFGIVIALVLALSWRFFDRPFDAPPVNAARIAGSPWLSRMEALRIGSAWALSALIAMLVAGQVWARAAERLAAPLPRSIALPEVPGWQRIPYAPRTDWRPRAAGADHRLLGRYADAEGREVDVFAAVYASQGEGREAGGFGQGAVPPDGPWAWQSSAPAIGGAHGERLRARGDAGRTAYTWYRTGDILTGSNARLKLAIMTDRLLLRPRPTTMLIVSAEEWAGAPSQPAVAGFVRAVGSVERWMDRIAGVG